MSTYRLSVALFVGGSTVAAAMTGLVVAFVGAGVRRWVPWSAKFGTIVLLLLVLLAMLAAVRRYPLPVPTRRWQVPRSWRRRGELTYALAFGVTLGFGILTVVNFAGFYVLIGLCLLHGTPALGALWVGLFGLSRSLPVAIAPVFARLKGRPYTVDSAVAGNIWLERFNQRAWLLRALALASVTGCCIGLLVG